MNDMDVVVIKTLVPSTTYTQDQEIQIYDSLREQLLETRKRLKQNPDYILYMKVQNELTKIHSRWARKRRRG